MNHALACQHCLSLINLEHNLKLQGKSEYPVLVDSTFVGGARQR
jgi:hypothetical protein